MISKAPRPGRRLRSPCSDAPRLSRCFGIAWPKCAANDRQQHVLGLDGIWGVALVIRGEIAAGIRWLEHSIVRPEREGYRGLADWFRLYLCEIYLEIISGKERPPAKVLAANMLTLAKVMFTAEKRTLALGARPDSV